MSTRSSFRPEELSHITCPLCDGAIRPKFSKKTVDGRFDVNECARCGFLFVNPTPSEASIIEFYSTAGHGERSHSDPAAALLAEQASPHSTIDARRIAATLASLTSGRRLLDVGCGYGFMSKAAQDIGFQCLQIEIASDELRAAKQLFGFQPEQVTFEGYEGTNFDAIIMSQVLEHARQPKEWLLKASQLLNSGGALAIALPNFSALTTDILQARDPYVTPPAHLNYFSEGNLRQAAEAAGFKQVHTETVSRYPRSAFVRKFGPLAPPLHAIFNVIAASLDSVGKGVMLNSFFIKID